MLVNYIFNRYTDRYYISNLDTAVALQYSISKQINCEDIAFSQSGTVPPNILKQFIVLPTDGEYTITLTRGSETQIILVKHYLKLQKGLLFNLKQALCGETCGCIDCLGLNDCVNYRSLFGQLLGYQYLIKPYTTEFCNSDCLLQTYLSQALDLNKCVIKDDLYAQLCGESLTGKSESSKQLVLYICAIYYTIYYFYEKLLAVDTEERSYVLGKFYWTQVQVCIKKLGINISQLEVLFSNIQQTCNVAPTVASITREFEDETPEQDFKIYNFIREDFTTGFNDVNGDLPKTVKILSNTFKGQLFYDGLLINGDNFTFDIADVERLSYRFVITETEPVYDKIFFQISDDNADPKFSDMASIAISVTGYVNQPPNSVGNNTFTLANRISKVFSIADFTSGTTPAYHDPEGDVLEAVRIDSLPVLGVLTLSNIPCIVGQIIPAASIAAGALVYTPPNQNPSAVAEFNFSVSDTGSHTFVS